MTQPMPAARRDLRGRNLGAIRMRAERTRALSGAPPEPAAQRPAKGPVRVGVWLPSTAIFLLLAPFALLAIPFLYLAPRRAMPAPARTILGLGSVLLALGGTVVEVDAADARVRIRLF